MTDISTMGPKELMVTVAMEVSCCSLTLPGVLWLNTIPKRGTYPTIYKN